MTLIQQVNLVLSTNNAMIRHIWQPLGMLFEVSLFCRVKKLTCKMEYEFIRITSISSYLSQLQYITIPLALNEVTQIKYMKRFSFFYLIYFLINRWSDKGIIYTVGTNEYPVIWQQTLKYAMK